MAYRVSSGSGRTGSRMLISHKAAPLDPSVSQNVSHTTIPWFLGPQLSSATLLGLGQGVSQSEQKASTKALFVEL